MKENAMTVTLSDSFPHYDTDKNSTEITMGNLFVQLLMPVKTELYNFIRKSMIFLPEADDVFQDAMLKGFRYFHSYDRNKSFKTWIFTLTHNLLKDRFKSMGKLEFNPIPIDEFSGITISGDSNHEVEEVREIYALASGLKARQREVFYLYYYNEFTVAEISEVTELTVTNVKFILHQARKAIKKIMEISS